MSTFLDRLNRLQPAREAQRWLYVPYDQLHGALGPLGRPSDELGIVLVESAWKARRRPYHKQKLALLLSNQRHFALEQAERGVPVRFLFNDGPFRDALRAAAEELGTLQVMRPAERELRADLAPLVDEGLLVEIPHEGWLTTRDQFEASQSPGKPFRMDAFYRRVRNDTGILMEDGSPVGGKYSFDAENRKPWRGTPETPEPPRFEPDETTREVVALVDARFPNHPGRVDAGALPASREDALRMLDWARDQCLPTFGPFEDAMSEKSRSLFHTRLSSLVNLHRLSPQEVLEAALDGELPLASREGFVRQVLGWREFVRHVHEATDGFRTLPRGRVETRDTPGDGGWSRFVNESWPAVPDGDVDGGAAPSYLDARRPLPPAFWGAPSGLRCLDKTVEQVWDEGYTHHIPRLMVLSNLATLLDVEPRDVTDWFWVAFTDAYDWVVEPNVLGMGTFGTGEVMTTKPYTCGASYINKMSDFCRGCAFDPKKDCPITSLYWDHLARKREKLEGNFRLRMILNSLRRRPAEKRAADGQVAEHVRRELDAGRPLSPAGALRALEEG